MFNFEQPPQQGQQEPEKIREKIGLSEASIILGIKPAELYKLAKDKDSKIEYIQYGGKGGRMLFYKDSVYEYLKDEKKKEGRGRIKLPPESTIRDDISRLKEDQEMLIRTFKSHPEESITKRMITEMYIEEWKGLPLSVLIKMKDRLYEDAARDVKGVSFSERETALTELIISARKKEAK